MSKIDLTDVSFLIPVRIDSKERLENLYAILQFFKSNFQSSIVVLEADKTEKVHHDLIDKKIFIEDHDPVFYRTKYLNKMTRASESKFLAIWDTDVIVPSNQIVESVKLLREEQADMIFPYDGKFYNVDPVISQLYVLKRDIDFLIKNQEKFHLAYGHFSVGGAFIVNRNKYMEAGMENENFYGWGPEDQERVKRWEILGYKVRKIDGVMYHLHHPRGINSGNYSVESNINLKKEFCKVCRMSRNELREYITTQKWLE